MIKQLAIEFTNGVRRQLTLAANSFLFLGADLEPVLISASPDVVTVSDTTQELSSLALVRRFRTGHAASVATLADGLYVGQRLTLSGTLGTAGDALTVTSATGLLKLSDSSALTSLDFDADDEFAVLEWRPTGWQVVATDATETV